MTELRFHPDLAIGDSFITMHFDRFDTKDDKRCIFKEKNNAFLLSVSNPLPQFNEKRNSYELLYINLKYYLSRNDCEKKLYEGFGFPTHGIRVKGTINDTELPGMEVDYMEGEVSFQWLPMFERLFREAHAIEQGIETSMQSVS